MLSKVIFSASSVNMNECPTQQPFCSFLHHFTATHETQVPYPTGYICLDSNCLIDHHLNKHSKQVLLAFSASGISKVTCPFCLFLVHQQFGQTSSMAQKYASLSFIS